MSSTLLELCLRTADETEQAARDLGARSGAVSELPGKCREFREFCQRVAENRKLDRVTIAFVGPRNAGKTTLLSAILDDEALSSKMPRGSSSDRTSKLFWISPEPPAHRNPKIEEWLEHDPPPVPGSDTPVAYVDVPGFDDIQPEFREIADFALTSSLVKVLVATGATIESAAIDRHLKATDGSMILPVVNRASGLPRKDIEAFRKRLRETLPHAFILEPVVVPDFEREGEQPKATVLADARKRILESLRQALDSATKPSAAIEQLAQPQLAAALEKFRAETARTVRSGLPATAEALARFEEAEAKLPAEVVGTLFADKESLASLVRGRIRKMLLDNTPVLFFPWRLMLAVSVLVWGVLDRLVLLFLGSLPSWISTGRQALRNVKDAWAFSHLEQSGVRKIIAEKAKAGIQPSMSRIRAALEADLGSPVGTSRAATSAEPLVEGAESAQETSSNIFSEVMAAASPSRRFSIGFAAAGTLLFWGIFSWPLLAVYERFFHAVAALLRGQSENPVPAFPEGIGSMIATSAFLALLPAGLLLLACVTLVTRKSKTDEALAELEARHRAEIADNNPARRFGKGERSDEKTAEPRTPTMQRTINLNRLRRDLGVRPRRPPRRRNRSRAAGMTIDVPTESSGTGGTNGESIREWLVPLLFLVLGIPLGWFLLVHFIVPFLVWLFHVIAVILKWAFWGAIALFFLNLICND